MSCHFDNLYTRRSIQKLCRDKEPESWVEVMAYIDFPGGIADVGTLFVPVVLPQQVWIVPVVLLHFVQGPVCGVPTLTVHGRLRYAHFVQIDLQAETDYVRYIEFLLFPTQMLFLSASYRLMAVLKYVVGLDPQTCIAHFDAIRSAVLEKITFEVAMFGIFTDVSELKVSLPP